MFSVPVILKVCDPAVYDQLCEGGSLGKTQFLKWEKKKMLCCVQALFVILKIVAITFSAWIERLLYISEDKVGYSLKRYKLCLNERPNPLDPFGTRFLFIKFQHFKNYTVPSEIPC